MGGVITTHITIPYVLVLLNIGQLCSFRQQWCCSTKYTYMSPILFILILLGVTALLLFLVEKYVWVTPSTERTITFAVIVVLVIIFAFLIGFHVIYLKGLNF